MLYLQSFTFNPFQENTYVIFNDKNQCWIVDPGMYNAAENSRLDDFINHKQLTPQAIINTHAHIDHILGAQYLKNKYNIPFHLHEKDQILLDNAIASAAMFGFDFRDTPKVDSYLKEGTFYQAGDDKLEIRFAPGHAPGHIVFYYPEGNWVFAGDVLFNGSIGRTDLPGGNFETLINSIHTQLFTLPDGTVVHSGHGPATTIGNEKLHNPFLQ